MLMVCPVTYLDDGVARDVRTLMLMVWLVTYLDVGGVARDVP